MVRMDSQVHRSRLNCDQFFQWFWNNVAEPLAETPGMPMVYTDPWDEVQLDSLESQLKLLARDGFAEWIVCRGTPLAPGAARDAQHRLERRWVANCNVFALYEQLQQWFYDNYKDIPSLVYHDAYLS